MTSVKLEQFNGETAATSSAADLCGASSTKPLLFDGKSAPSAAKICFIDEEEEEDDDEPGADHGQTATSAAEAEEEKASSSSTVLRRHKNGLISSHHPLIPTNRRTVSLLEPLPYQINRSAEISSAVAAADAVVVKRPTKKAVFKVSLVTVDNDDDDRQHGYCNNNYGGATADRRKYSWLPTLESRAAKKTDQHQNEGGGMSDHHLNHHFLPLAPAPKVPTTTTTKSAKRCWRRPYKIWRDIFLREHNCRREELCKEVFLSALPHLGVLFVVSAYILLGTFVFRQLDHKLATLPLHDVLLYAFTTITTIGYGNIVPRTQLARLACVVYCLVGIPLVFLPLSNLGELLADFYWVGIVSMKGQKDDDDVDHLFCRAGPSRLPLKVVVLLILFHSLLGGLIFHFWIQKLPIFPAIYFSFISITTIGFGDLCPEPQNVCETVVIIVYLSCGIAIMSTLFNTLGDHLRRIHYLGRDFVGAPDVRVWFGGQPLTVRELVALVASRFEIAPERLREVLAELDALIRLSDYGNAARLTTPSFRENDHDQDEDNDDAVGIANADHQEQQKQPFFGGGDLDDELLQHQQQHLQEEQSSSYSPTSSINSEQQQMIQALSTLHRLTVKGTRTFHTPSLNSLSLLIRSASSPNHQQQNNQFHT